MIRYFLHAAGTWLFVVIILALALTLVLISANSGPFSPSAVIELFIAMFWVCGALNLVFLMLIAVAWPAVVRLSSGRIEGSWVKYLISGLAAANIVWILWNRLAVAGPRAWLTNQSIRLMGIIEILALVIIALFVMLGVFRFLRLKRIDPIFLAFGMISVLLAALILAWNGFEERQVRIFPLDEIRIAAGIEDETSAAGSASYGNGPVVLLGIDGLSWNVLVPLLEAGKLPAIAGLIRNGAWGYLDNGNESLSPIIWSSVFTGRLPEAHGVRGFYSVRLPKSKAYVENLLIMEPSINTFYGLGSLVQSIPNPSLWEITTSTTKPRSTPFLWEILSFYGRHVTVIDPLVIDKDKTVKGAMILFREADPQNTSYAYPEMLAAKWRKFVESKEVPKNMGKLDFFNWRFENEADFAMGLMEEFDSDLKLYYFPYLDTAAHYNWNFLARDDFFLSWTQRSLSNEEWKRAVLDNIENAGFEAYLRVDRLTQRIVDANPEATFVLVSDHGWSYSGYEHFGSPDGVVIISGPNIKSGLALKDVSILDITPTVLGALNVPVSEELDGRAVNRAFNRETRSERVSRYPDAIVGERDSDSASISNGSDETDISKDEKERLRALGYIQ